MPRTEKRCECGYVATQHMPRHIQNCVARPFAIRVKELESELTMKKQTNGNGTKRKRGDCNKIAIYALVRKATCAVVYVGKTGHVDRRMQQHSSYKSQCRLVRDAFMKEGRDSFEIRPLMYCTEADADRNESMMITKLNTIHPNGLNFPILQQPRYMNSIVSNRSVRIRVTRLKCLMRNSSASKEGDESQPMHQPDRSAWGRIGGSGSICPTSLKLTKKLKTHIDNKECMHQEETNNW